jgi:hypothetical protein
MYLKARFPEALPAPRRSWLDIIARVLVKWVRGPRAPRRSRWYDSDGVASKRFAISSRSETLC